MRSSVPFKRAIHLWQHHAWPIGLTNDSSCGGLKFTHPVSNDKHLNVFPVSKPGSQSFKHHPHHPQNASSRREPLLTVSGRMPSVNLYTRPSEAPSSIPNPLPQLLQTPSGLAILEIQGTIHAPIPTAETSSNETSVQTAVGKLEFPLYDPANSSTDEKWMKKVYFYVGKHQRLSGEVKKLNKPLAVIRKRTDGQNEDDLEIAEIVKFKIMFQGRPEPVSNET